MASEPKTKPTDVPVADFIATVEHEGRREDAKVVDAILTEVSGQPAVMWGPSIVGYGVYRGATGDWPVLGFSPRKANMVLYLMPGFDTDDADLLARMGKHKTSVACLYLNRLKDTDLGALRELAGRSLARTRAKYPDAT